MISTVIVYDKARRSRYFYEAEAHPFCFWELTRRG